jgi:periplasmic protein CpxP/Spy
VKTLKLILPAVALAAALGGAGIATLPVPQAMAQAAAPGAPPPPAAQARPQRPPREFRSHIEGRIAFMKAELKVTPAQEANFDKVAQVMRQNDRERRQRFEEMRAQRDQPHSAVQHMETRARFAAVQAQHTDRLLAAFRPLYDSFTPDQKKAADDLMAPHMGRHFGPRR